MHHTRRLLALGLLAGMVWGPGCSCGSLSGDEGPVPYVRCGQADVPGEASWSVGGLAFRAEGRTLTVSGKKAFRIAAFEGPVGAPLTAAEVALLAADKPDLALYMGGLGDDETMAKASLKALSTQPYPVLFLPGGADRWPVVEEAFDSLSEQDRQRRVLLAGIHRLVVGDTEWAVMPGAPLGRYAVGDEACGFGPEDVEGVAESFDKPGGGGGGRRLLTWTAPSGWGLSAGLGRLEVGSPDLHILAEAIGAEAGLFAYPRGEGSGLQVGAKGKERWIVPRLGPGGSVAADGAYRRPGAVVLELGP